MQFDQPKRREFMTLAVGAAGAGPSEYAHKVIRAGNIKAE